MQFGLSETQETLKKSAREFLNAECPIATVRKLIETETAFDAGLWSKIAAQGWTGLLIPEEYGGYGMGMVEMGVVLEEMGYALLPGPFLSTMLAAAIIERGGTESQKRKYLPEIANGHLKGTVAIAPFRFVLDAGVADFIIQASESALVITDRFQARHTPALDLTRPLYEIEAEASAENLNLDALQPALDLATAGLTAEMTGGMQRLLEITVAYAKTRKQFGRPIGQFQAVQHLCADMLLLTESSRSAAYYACYAVHEQLPETRGSGFHCEELCERSISRGRQPGDPGPWRDGLPVGERLPSLLPARESLGDRFRRCFLSSRASGKDRRGRKGTESRGVIPW